MKLTRSQQDLFLAELLVGATIKDAAEKAGFSESTAHRLMKNSGFLRRYDDVHTARLLQITHALAEVSLKAVKKLVEIMESGPVGMQLKAAIALLDQNTRVVVADLARDKAWTNWTLKEIQQYQREQKKGGAW